VETVKRARLVALVFMGVTAFAALWLYAEALSLGRSYIRDLFYIWLHLTWPMAAVVAPLVFFSRRRVAWRWWEAAAFLLPYVAYFALGRYFPLPKSLANLGELGVILFGVPFAAVLRIALARRAPQLPVAVALQLALIVAPAFPYFSTPMLPE
jgi:hypothetical protein